MRNGQIENEYKLSRHINNQLKYKDGISKDASLQKLLQTLDAINIDHAVRVDCKK